MPISAVRSRVLVIGAIAFVVLAAACSSGDKHVSVGTTTTSARDDVANETSTSTSTKRAVKKKAATKSATSTTRGKGRSSTNGSGPDTTVGASGDGIYVPVDGAPQDPTPTTPPRGTTPTTSRTPTTVAGPKPYDPSKPIDLSGTPGVSPQQQARAEQLVRDTLRDIPRYADPQAAYADGYRSIGDGVTGDEHYVKWAYLSDGRILDSKHPESLVYEMRNGRKTLVAAMYTLELGSSFADVPDVGGALTQWHIHNDLCLADDPNDPLRKVVSSLTTVNGTCPPGTSKAGATPMLHVWIVKNSCGPFAALEGIGGGQVPPGETRNCDTRHGSR